MFSISVKEIQEQFEDKTRKRLEIYRKILERCFHTIKQCATSDNTFCFFEVPPVKLGLPIYKVDQCLKYIEMKLKEKGFQVKPVSKTMVYISWPLKTPDYRRLEYLSAASRPLALPSCAGAGGADCEGDDEDYYQPRAAATATAALKPAVPSLLKSCPVNIPLRLPRDVPAVTPASTTRRKNVMRCSTPVAYQPGSLW